MDYDVLVLSLAMDLVAISVLTYAIYFRRHHRRDLTLGFLGVNVGLFAVASFVSTRPVGLAFGIGLFALLSVIRLRSTQVTQEEIGYYFVAIVIGLANGLSPDEHWGTTITLTAVLVGVMYVADHPRMLRRYERRIVKLKSSYRDPAEVRALLEYKLGGEILKVVVIEVDLVQKHTRLDVRFRPDPPGTHRPAPVGKHRDEAPAEAPDGAGTVDVAGTVDGAETVDVVAAARTAPAAPGPAPREDGGPDLAADELPSEVDEDPGAR